MTLNKIWVVGLVILCTTFLVYILFILPQKKSDIDELSIVLNPINNSIPAGEVVDLIVNIPHSEITKELQFKTQFVMVPRIIKKIDSDSQSTSVFKLILTDSKELPIPAKRVLVSATYQYLGETFYYTLYK